MRAYTINCTGFDVRHYELWRFDVSRFSIRVSHAPKDSRRAKLVYVDMGKANGSECLVRRWWLYLRSSTWCFDYIPMAKKAKRTAT